MRLLRFAAAVLVLAACGWFLLRRPEWRNLDLRATMAGMSVPLLTASLLGLLVSNLCLPFAWRSLSNALGHKQKVLDAVEIVFISTLTTYIPGKVFTVASQAALSKHRAIPVPTALLTSLLYLVLTTIVSLQVFLITLIFRPAFPWPAALGVCLAALVLFAAGTWQRPLQWLVRIAARRSGATVPAARTRGLFLCQAWLLGSWIFLAGGFWFLLNAFRHSTLRETMAVTGAFSAGWLAGFYTLLVPGGLGVREGAQVLLLKPQLGLALAIQVALLIRIWMTAMDWVLIGIGLTVKATRGADDQRALSK